MLIFVFSLDNSFFQRIIRVYSLALIIRVLKRTYHSHERAKMITQRQNDILNLIVELFTRHHEPVGSKALQEMISSSSATIRNDMAKLEQLGLLEKHTRLVEGYRVELVFNIL